MNNSPNHHVEPLLIIKRDYITSLFLLSPFVLWAAVLIRKAGSYDIQPFLIIAAAGSVMFITFGLWRMGYILSLAEKGITVKGALVQIIMRKNKGRVEFSYAYQNQRYTGFIAFRSREPLQDTIKKGMEFLVCISPNNPRRVMIPALFQEENCFFTPKQ